MGSDESGSGRQENDGRGSMANANTQLPAEVYEQLRAVARSMMLNARHGHTLQATAVANEAWIRLYRSGVTISDRGAWFGLASRVIRQVLVDHARRKSRQKRGGGATVLSLDDRSAPDAQNSIDLVALDEALKELAAFGPRQARVVELRFFGGMTMSEIAEVIGVSKRTIENDWAAARAWLRQRIDVEE